MATLYPILSPMLWPSIATGKRTHKHGIYGFAELDPVTGGIQSHHEPLAQDEGGSPSASFLLAPRLLVSQRFPLRGQSRRRPGELNCYSLAATDRHHYLLNYEKLEAPRFL
ncbi:MAG: alkaline phosphatase family protein [Chthoniobacterales bacterium]